MPRRRTQVERREATIRKLLDAVTRTLIEVGYARTTVQEICARAGVSQGGLFRHFPTLEALMVAVGEDVGARILAQYRREFERLPHPPLAAAIRLVRDSVRSPLNQAWYELAFASRTRPALHKALRPIAVRYDQNIGDLGRQLLPELADALGERFSIFVDTLLAIFDGELAHRLLLKKPELEEARVDLMVGFIQMLVQPRQKPADARRGGPGGRGRRSAGARGLAEH